MATSCMIRPENPSKDPNLPEWYTIANFNEAKWIAGFDALGSVMKNRKIKENKICKDFVKHVDEIKKQERKLFRMRRLLEDHHRRLKIAVNLKLEGKMIPQQRCFPDGYETISTNNQSYEISEAAVNFIRSLLNESDFTTTMTQEEITLILELCSDFDFFKEQDQGLKSACKELYEQLQHHVGFGQGNLIAGTGAASGIHYMKTPTGAHQIRPMNQPSQPFSGSTSGSEPNHPPLNTKNTQQRHDDAKVTREATGKTVRTIRDDSTKLFKEQEQMGGQCPSHRPDHPLATGSELPPTPHHASPSPLVTQQDCSSQNPQVIRKSPEDNNVTRQVDLDGSIKDENSETIQEKPSGLPGKDMKDDGRLAKDYKELSSRYSDFKRDVERIVEIKGEVSDEKVIEMVDAVIKQHKLDLKNSRHEAELLKYEISVLKEHYCREFRFDGKLMDREVVPVVCEAFKQQSTIIQRLESDVNKYRNSLQKLQSDVQTLKERRVRDQDDLTYLRNEVQRYKISIDETTHSLKTEKEKRRLIEKEKNELTERFSRFMHDKISLNDSSTENINMPNRPSQITESYKELITGPWMDVIETVKEPDASSLQSSMDSNEIEAMEAVSDIMMLCWRTAKEVLEKYKSERRSLLREPVVAVLPDKRKEEDMEVQASGDTYSSLGMDKPVAAPRKASLAGGKAEPVEKAEDDAKYFDNQLLAGLLNNLKFNAGRINIDPLVESVKCKALDDEKIRCMMTKETMARHDVHDFIEKCCRICWKMAIQQPPMSLSVDGLNEPMDKEKQELYYDCRRQKNSVVLFYVKPALIHDTKVMQQGMVYIGVKK